MVKQTAHPVKNGFLSLQNFQGYAWGGLVYTLLVILWGVYVRATGSGAGCGGHWPTCNGQIVPTSAQTSTLIEFTHRLTSGLTVFLAAGLVLWAWRIFPRKHPVRLLSACVVIFTLTEALIGAGLVLFGLTQNTAPVAQAFAVSIHLVNTMLLIGSMALTAWKASEGDHLAAPVKDKRRILPWLTISLAGMLILSVAGTVTAMGDTLFPVSTLSQGIQQDLSPVSNFLLHLRVIHPVMAVILVAYTSAVVFWIRSKPVSLNVFRFSGTLLMLLICQLLLGATNVLLLAPIWMQLVHLLFADLVWIVMVLFSVEAVQPKQLETAGF